ncbi:MAG TPA: hypothetical protein ENN97_04675 [Phycisphaerales bacterium]|mgnify:CR=1 FL=1|nr:hypothetical protein [Phycisphaerales bacterium]
MKSTTTTLFAIAAAVLLTMAGCDMSASRKQGAQMRFEETMDQARLETARRSLAEGRYAYARKVLEPCLNSPRRHDDAEQLMAQIQTAHQVYAQLNAYRQDSDDSERVY